MHSKDMVIILSFNKIDLQNWNRKNTFNHFFTDVPCTYSMCVDIDVTDLLKMVKRDNLKFFPTFLYGMSKILNSHKEFKMSIDSENNIGYYDIINPCYAFFHEKSELFSNIWTEYNEDFDVFYDNYSSDVATYGNENYLDGKPNCGNNIFNVSCIPWTSFNSFNLNLQNSYDYLPPIFTIGKYRFESGRALLPFAIQVHHAVCDGFHTARFVNELQEWCKDFTQLI